MRGLEALIVEPGRPARDVVVHQRIIDSPCWYVLDGGDITNGSLLGDIELL